MSNKELSPLDKDARFFCSWSGGKDSCLALHRACEQGAHPDYLLTVLTEDTVRSRSHGLRRDVLEAQAASMNVPLLVRSARWSEYEALFVDALQEMRKQEVDIGIFGDIDFPPHLEWEQKVCAAADMTHCLPLWECSRDELLESFIGLGYKALIVTIEQGKLGREFLGKTIDMDLVQAFKKEGIDPCGENGEYHTVVIDGPLFSEPLKIKQGELFEQPQYDSIDIQIVE